MIYWHPMVILRREMPMMHKIRRDERWLESEKRGYDVGEKDDVVEARVCEIVQQVGEVMRGEAENLLRQVTRLEYRLVQHKKPTGNETLMIHRVFCEEDGKVCGVCASPHVPCGDSPATVANQMNVMSQAISAPMLKEEDFPFADWSLSRNMLPGI
jgi:hypothetical protein